MNSEILNDIRQKYEELKVRRGSTISLINRIKALDKEIKETEKEGSYQKNITYLKYLYAALKKELSTVYKSDEFIQQSDDALLTKSISQTFASIWSDKQKTIHTNAIYVYMGKKKATLKEIHWKNNVVSNYKEYRNIESPIGVSNIQIPIDKAWEFERKNHIIFIDTNNCNVIYEKFELIQKDFFETAFQYNQKEACQKVLNKNYQKEILKNKNKKDKI